MDTPRPLPPERPLPGDCCDGGCDRCIFDLHAEAMAEYARRLAEWEAAHPTNKPGAHTRVAEGTP